MSSLHIHRSYKGVAYPKQKNQPLFLIIYFVLFYCYLKNSVLEALPRNKSDAIS